MNWILLLLFLPSRGVAQDQTKHDAQWMRAHATEQEYSAYLQAVKARKAAGGYEETGNQNLDFVRRLQNQQTSAERRREEAIKNSSEVSAAGKASIQIFAKKISSKCKIPDTQIEANNWNEISGLSVTILADCSQPVARVIESLNELRREMKLQSVKKLAFFDSVNSYRTFPVIQVVIGTGHVEYSNGTRRAITTTYAFSTQNLDSYLRGKMSENKFLEKTKKVVTTPQ